MFICVKALISGGSLKYMA